MKISIKRIFDNFEELLASVFLFVTVSLVLVNVFLRYFLKTGIYWSEEVATGCFVWSVFLGAAAGFKRKMHVGVDFLVDRTPVKIRGLIKTIVAFILLFINLYITYIAVIYLRVSHTKPTPVLGISSAYISTSILAGFSLMTLYSVRFIVTDIIQMRKKEA